MNGDDAIPVEMDESICWGECTSFEKTASDSVIWTDAAFYCNVSFFPSIDYVARANKIDFNKTKRGQKLVGCKESALRRSWQKAFGLDGVCVSCAHSSVNLSLLWTLEARSQFPCGSVSSLHMHTSRQGFRIIKIAQGVTHNTHGQYSRAQRDHFQTLGRQPGQPCFGHHQRAAITQTLTSADRTMRYTWSTTFLRPNLLFYFFAQASSTLF